MLISVHFLYDAVKTHPVPVSLPRETSTPGGPPGAPCAQHSTRSAGVSNFPRILW